MQANQTFNRTVQQALKHYKDVSWLGNESPLATTYFISRYIQPSLRTNITAEIKGEALQKLIRMAAHSLWPKDLPESQSQLLKEVEAERAVQGSTGAKYLFLILELRYLRAYFPSRSAPIQVKAMHDFLNVSESRFFEHLKIAQVKLAQSIIQLVKPSLRLEEPSVPKFFVGRTNQLQFCVDSLLQNQSISISGLGGIGKTTLAEMVVNKCVSKEIFWYTFRPGLNDYLQAVLFSLSHFLHQQGYSQLWMYLLSQNGEVGDLSLYLGFLENDLSQLSSLPVFCFDEIDLLNTDTSTPRHKIHILILELLEFLKGKTPLLFIGQRNIIDTDIHIQLPPLLDRDIQKILDRSEIINITPNEVRKFSDGNPRVIELLVALVQSGLDKDIVLRQPPLIAPLFSRLWKRLNISEQTMLAELSVFRGLAPSSEFEPLGLDQLATRYLLHHDVNGGVEILPILKQIILEMIPDSVKSLAHQNAARIRIAMGEVTNGVYHLCHGQLMDDAVFYWYEHQDSEIKLGKAIEAQQIFAEVNYSRLSKSNQKRLKVIQNRFFELVGEFESILDGIDSFSWNPNEKLTTRAMHQWGGAYYRLGKHSDALETFDQSIFDLNQIHADIIKNLSFKSRVQMELTDFTAAERTLLEAKFSVAYMESSLSRERGEYKKSIKPLDTAYSIATVLDDWERIAQIEHLLAISYGMIGQIDKALEYAEKAIKYYQDIGDFVTLEGIYAELGGFHLNCGQYIEAITSTERALEFFEKINHALWIPRLCNTLAEAYFETGNINKAETYAHRAIQSENQRVQPYAWYTLGQIHYQKNDIEAADFGFSTGISIATQNEDLFILAYLQRAYGETLLKENKKEQGFPLLIAAKTLFTQMEINAEADKTEDLINYWTSSA